VTATPLATLPPTATLTTDEQAKQFQDNKDSIFRDLRKQTGMSDADINSYFELQALREALQNAVTTDITTKGPFVDARHILVATEEEAQDVINSLNAGESFADLAKAVSTDTGSGANGGELGWNPVTIYVKEFQEAVKTAEIGAIVGPIKTQFGYHVIQVRAREERDLTQDQINQAKSSAFTSWLNDYKASKKDKTTTNSVWANYVPTDPQTIFG
jgi:parvulin-like peptidyl-prolyl isomerase